LIFCMDFALKSHAHETAFAALHAIHRSGHAIGNDANDPVMDQNNRDTFSIAPASLLPAIFFEHAQSATALHSVMNNSDPLAGAIADEIREKIRERRGAQKYLPTSIEFLRQQFLLQAIVALNDRHDPAAGLFPSLC
jgi:hypothetical protein